MLAVLDLDYQGETEHNESKEEYMWSTGDSLGQILVLPCLVIKVNGKP